MNPVKKAKAAIDAVGALSVKVEEVRAMAAALDPDRINQTAALAVGQALGDNVPAVVHGIIAEMVNDKIDEYSNVINGLNAAINNLGEGLSDAAARLDGIEVAISSPGLIDDDNETMVPPENEQNQS